MLKALKKLISKPEEPAPKAADTTPRQAAPAHAPKPNEGANREPKPRNRDRKRPAKPPAAPVKPWSINDFQVPPAEGKTRFHDFPLPDSLMRGIQDQGFSYCTPIQAAVLGSTLRGHDAIGRAQTGTGKTAAFLVSTITQLLETPPPDERYMGEPRALIIAPTRELVMQIASDAEGLTKHCPLNVMTFVGGMDIDKPPPSATT